jgi:hypothetical protein
MNGNVSRRVFVGSLAGAGVGAVGATSLLDFPVSAQPASAAPLTREIRRQLKEALGKMRDGQAIGARQAATVLRLYASTVNDSQLQATIRKANRHQILLTQPNHEELVRQAKELGFDPARLPPHQTYPYADREAVLDRLTKEGLGALMREAADHVDSVGDKLELVPRQQREALVQRIALQPVPTERDCGNCDAIESGMQTAALVFDAACALALLFPIPPNEAACAAAAAAFAVMLAAYGACQAIVQLCRYYYGY